MQRTTGEMLYRLLANGGRISHDAREYAMANDGSLAVIVPDSGDLQGLKVDCDMAGFAKLAEDIGREKIWLALCVMSLKKVRSNER